MFRNRPDSADFVLLEVDLFRPVDRFVMLTSYEILQRTLEPAVTSRFLILVPHFRTFCRRNRDLFCEKNAHTRGLARTFLDSGRTAQISACGGILAQEPVPVSLSVVGQSLRLDGCCSEAWLGWPVRDGSCLTPLIHDMTCGRQQILGD
jgi:hypothetical protein